MPWQSVETQSRQEEGEYYHITTSEEVSEVLELSFNGELMSSQMTIYSPLQLQVIDNSEACIKTLKDRFNRKTHKVCKGIFIRPDEGKKILIELSEDGSP